MLTIKLHGSIPSFKNSKLIVRHGTRSALITKPEYRKAMDALVLQARAAYRGEPLENPGMIVQLYAKAARQDPDNMLACIMDVLVEAGILRDDNLKRCNGPKVMPSAILGGLDGAVIRLLPAPADFEILASLAADRRSLAL